MAIMAKQRSAAAAARWLGAFLLFAASLASGAEIQENLPMKANVKREDGKAWIDGVPALGWGKQIECTYAGAVAAALAVTEHPVSYEEIMGFSGLAFRLRWWLSSTKPGDHGW